MLSIFPENLESLKNWNAFDSAIFDTFNETFWTKIKNYPNFADDLKILTSKIGNPIFCRKSKKTGLKISFLDEITNHCLLGEKVCPPGAAACQFRPNENVKLKSYELSDAGKADSL